MAKQTYIDFDEYIRQGEPDKAERAEEWKVAIGLQAVDGLTPSEYLQEAARRNIEGEITIDEVSQLLHQYYESKTARIPDDDDTEECDKASANIKRILSSRTFAFNTNGYIATHRRIFEGIFKHVGTLRKYDITKKEFVLSGDTVNYLNWEDLRRAIDYDLQQERDFSYKGLTDTEKIQRLCRFTADLWQIHAFCEGNTRTTAVFLIQYLRSIGYKNVNNDMFAGHSWYFRNALVRANYKNISLGVEYDYTFLERFFRNLLLGENNELKNRYMVINAPQGLTPTDKNDTGTQKTTQKTTQKGKTTTQKKILDYLKEHPEATRKKLAEVLGTITEDGVKFHLAKLQEKGLLKREGGRKEGKWVVIDN